MKYTNKDIYEHHTIQYCNVGHLLIDENENELSANEAACKI